MRAVAFIAVMLMCSAAFGQYDAGIGNAALAWARQHGASAKVVVSVSQAGDVIEWPDGIEKPTAAWLIAPSNHTDAAMWLNAQEYPAPDITVPMVNTNGNPIGTCRIVVDAATLEPVAVINTASPQRPWSEQRAAIASNRTDRAAVVSTLKALKTSMTNTIANATNALGEAQALSVATATWTNSNQRAYLNAARVAAVDAARAAKQSADDLNALRKVLLQYFKEIEL